ncbi:MAG: molybdate ABC transporter substrate-binding protein [Bacillota bacterium]|nr:molybdate ABC transporter substrate-binding protein [Bacillota bacterium]
MEDFEMKKIYFALMALFITTITVSCSSGNQSSVTKSENVELTVSAAASLNDALTELVSMFEKDHQNIHLLLNFGSTGALQQQIVQGAPVDLFISAAKDKFELLIKKDLVQKKGSIDLLGNDLVLITNKQNPTQINSFSNLTDRGIKKLAIGTPETVPAGKYAMQTLKKSHIWSTVKPKIIFTKDVRQVLTYVESGDVDAGIVYMTDAKISDKVKLAAVADKSLHDPIIYPAGILKASKHPKEASKFLSYLQSKQAKAIFEKYGFKVLD